MSTDNIMQFEVNVARLVLKVRRNQIDDMLELAHEYVWNEVLIFNDDPTDRNHMRARSAIGMLMWLESKLL